MAKDRALTLEALRVMDAIERRGSFAAAAEELGRVPSALSYTMQKLEDELDVVIFDRSGHRTKFTNVGRLLLERGRFLLDAADKLATDAEALARGWEPQLTIVCEAFINCEYLYPLIDRLAAQSDTRLNLFTEVLAGAWESLEEGRADIVVAPSLHCRTSTEINSRKLLSMKSVYVACAGHPILSESDPDAEEVRLKYRAIAVADSARKRPTITVQVLDKQPRVTVSNLENKYRAILAGFGVGVLPLPMIEEDLRQGRLQVISNTDQREFDVIMAWRRDSMGEAKAWALREIPKVLAKRFPQ